MGWAETEMRCKKHPKNKQTPGVCSYCLREKLTKLSSANNSSSNGTGTEEGSSCSSSLSSSPYSSAETSYSSPLHDHGFTSSSDGKGSGLFLKSRSVITFIPRIRKRSRNAVEDSDEKKKLGFWSKLFRSTGKKTKKMLLHSKTMR
ncbi:uncharacterized protein LOC122646385 [Telopea speciosissima]|uniref:uncharacterized protein LOC122646385 n=1 Tax=Telopea speciosissima TaxID=54955 RepID=UPI001CC6B8B9|nr:uncharacterized protein LOC122646385 [Telopea speciosissima]